MNFVDLVRAHVDGSAREADTRALVATLDRAVRSNDNACTTARAVIAFASSGQFPVPWEIRVDGCVWAANGQRLGAIDWAMADETKMVDMVNTIGPLAEQHLVTVARLEADKHALSTLVTRLEGHLSDRDKMIAGLRQRVMGLERDLQAATGGPIEPRCTCVAESTAELLAVTGLLPPPPPCSIHRRTS